MFINVKKLETDFEPFSIELKIESKEDLQKLNYLATYAEEGINDEILPISEKDVEKLKPFINFLKLIVTSKKLKDHSSRV